MFDREKLLYEGDTELEHYQIVDMVYEGRKARVLFSGNRDAAFSGMPLDDGQDLLFDYIQRFFELAATLRPKKLLVIGGGVYTLPMALLHALPDISIDVAEIDPGLDELAEGFFGMKADPRMRIFHADGKNFLLNTKETYDMIIVDAFTHLQIPASLAGKSTSALIYKRLNPNGVMAMNIISAYWGRRSAAIRHFYSMYDTAFEKTNVFPADTSVSYWMSQNFILTAQKGSQEMPYGLRFEALEPPKDD
jgi:spermidine synthase